MIRRILIIPVIFLSAFLLKGCYTSGTLAEETTDDVFIYNDPTLIVIDNPIRPILPTPPAKPVEKYRNQVQIKHNHKSSKLRNSNGISNRGKKSRYTRNNVRNHRRWK